MKPETNRGASRRVRPRSGQPGKRPSGRQTTQSYPQRGRCITLSRGGSNLDENGGSNLAARQHTEEISLMRSLKALFDPNSILNSGRIL
ncbi:hypothetical protein HI802_14780 [Ralstonia solanacearum]|nr:hypothetical protein HI802_14780 [Ralstonia solanacearum]QKL98337.1 hypothetical protein HI801_14780 [Ralstonia solanacearum]QLR08226.1 hypothetical protein H1A20_14685 [Ralstonia solanacearum]